MKQKNLKPNDYSSPMSTTINVGFEGILCGSTEDGKSDKLFETDDFFEIDKPYFG